MAADDEDHTIEALDALHAAAERQEDDAPVKPMSGHRPPRPPSPELLERAHREPGRCAPEDLARVRDWLARLKIDLDAYRAAYGEPLGGSVDAKIETLDWFLVGPGRNRD